MCCYCWFFLTALLRYKGHTIVNLLKWQNLMSSDIFTYIHILEIITIIQVTRTHHPHKCPVVPSSSILRPPPTHLPTPTSLKSATETLLFFFYSWEVFGFIVETHQFVLLPRDGHWIFPRFWLTQIKLPRWFVLRSSCGHILSLLLSEHRGVGWLG